MNVEVWRYFRIVRNGKETLKGELPFAPKVTPGRAFKIQAPSLGSKRTWRIDGGLMIEERVGEGGYVTNCRFVVGITPVRRGRMR